MAIIILGRSCCALCGAVLEQGQQLFATSHFVADPAHELWRFSDSGMHQSCFLAWPRRQEFVDLYNRVHLQHARGTRFMQADGTVVERDPQPRVDS